MNRRSLLALLMFLSLAVAALVSATAGAVPVEGRSSDQSVRKISYGAGIEISRLSGDERKLKGTPAGFK